MSTKTTNLELTKPEQDEYYNVAVFNANNDVIDGAIGDIGEDISDLQTKKSNVLTAGANISLTPNAETGAIAVAVYGTVPNATNATNAVNATNAANDVDGNAIKTTYLKRSGEYISISQNTILTALQSGKRIQAEIAGIIITMPPVANGLHYIIYNNSNNSITLNAVVAFDGTYGNGTTTLSIPTKGTVSLFSNGTNWIVIFNNGALAKTEIFTGKIVPADVSDHQSAFSTTATIPLPTGYTREQCHYSAHLSKKSMYFNGGYLTTFFHIDQVTGIIHMGATEASSSSRYSTKEVEYTCIATK